MERLVLLPHSPRPPGVPTTIRCQVNPGELEIARDAGLVPRPPSAFARASGSGASLAFGGGARTSLKLRLLFETETAAAAAAGNRPPTDVRTLTEPLFRLAAPAPGHGERPCPVDLIWGKAWSFTGAVARLAETLDRFTPAGIATRAWLQVEFEQTGGNMLARAGIR